MIEGNEDESEEFMNVKVGNTNGNMSENNKIEEYGLSLNALDDNYAHNIIKIKEIYQEKELTILISNGRTYNFIDE